MCVFWLIYYFSIKLVKYLLWGMSNIIGKKKTPFIEHGCVARTFDEKLITLISQPFVCFFLFLFFNQTVKCVSCLHLTSRNVKKRMYTHINTGNCQYHPIACDNCSFTVINKCIHNVCIMASHFTACINFPLFFCFNSVVYISCLWGTWISSSETELVHKYISPWQISLTLKKKKKIRFWF